MTDQILLEIRQFIMSELINNRMPIGRHIEEVIAEANAIEAYITAGIDPAV